MMSVASFALAADHPVFDGHFPGRPIVPGAYLLALVVQQADDWLAARGWSQRIAGVASVKFLRPVAPAETCALRLAPVEARQLRFELEVAAAPVARGVLQLLQP